MPVDENSEKVVLSVENVLLSRHKDVAPEDSDDPQDIGLSSEEEAEDLPELPHVRRKYHQTPGPPPPPVPEPTPPVTTASTSTSTTDTATIQVPVAALEQVHAILGQIISGQNPQVSTSGGSTPLQIHSHLDLHPSQCQLPKEVRSSVSYVLGNFGPLKPSRGI